jgi:hypothetical protein
MYSVRVEHREMTYAVMFLKTQALYVALFEKVKSLVPQFTPSHAMADFEEASVSGFQHAFGSVNISGYWFHYMLLLLLQHRLYPHVKYMALCLIASPTAMELRWYTLWTRSLLHCLITSTLWLQWGLAVLSVALVST